MLTAFAEKAPLRRNVSQEDVAASALYLLGPQSQGVTGEIIYVDCGYNVMGM
jgi:enoyl-[acyl-carrier protein] reductase I